MSVAANKEFTTNAWLTHATVYLQTSFHMGVAFFHYALPFILPVSLTLLSLSVIETTYREGIHIGLLTAIIRCVFYRGAYILAITSLFLILLPLVKRLTDRIMADYERKIRIIHFEGNIAAGKSTMCANLATELLKYSGTRPLSSVRIRPEFMPASLLKAFKKDPAGKTLAVQNFGIWHRTASYYQELHESTVAVRNSPFGGPAFVLMDRGILGDSLFLICNKLLGNCCPEDYEVYADAVSHRSIRQAFWAPGQATVFFNVALRRCIQNLRGRGTVDSDTENAYLRAVHYTHLYGILWLQTCPKCSQHPCISQRGPIIAITPKGDSYPEKDDVSQAVVETGKAFDCSECEHTHETDFPAEMFAETQEIATNLRSKPFKAHEEEALRQLVARKLCMRSWIAKHATEDSAAKYIFDQLDDLWLTARDKTPPTPASS